MIFSAEIIHRVWKKAEVDDYNAPNDFRKDSCGAWIERTQYGNHDSVYGWEIDHIVPQSSDADDLSNLRPLHWKNSTQTDGSLVCHITSSGTTNIDKI
jgi:hypothetical protein